MDIYKKIEQKLVELGLAELNSRPYDCAHSVLECNASDQRLVVVGFNGSDADLEWTNLSAVQHGKANPLESNVINGAQGAWLSTTLPKRLLALPEELGFSSSSTVYTNAILLCSENAAAVKKKAKAVGFSGVDVLVDRSLDFFEQVTIAEFKPDLILAYSNSLNDLSAASVLRKRFAVGEIYQSNRSRYYNTFSFMSQIAGRRVPVVCIRHMSRFKPCVESIREAWDFQVKTNG
ncbi:hypothetical protein [Shewanella jiangmenensis]|nr:hypothetical protein [Shewanella jiangmenensis]